MKLKKHQPLVKPADSGDPTPIPEEIIEQVNQNITCSYGIHRGNFPVAGMKVKDARAVLKKLIKVDPAAVAVINGSIVNDEHVITSETTMLSFVKTSAIKGAESEVITIDGSSVKLDGQKIAVDKFCGIIAKNTVSGLAEQPIPDNVKWIVRAGNVEVYIVELKPELRSIKWLADNSPSPYGPQATYTQRRLATPYVILKAPFRGGALQGKVELFYRNLPLTSLDDDLCHCNLLNVSIAKRITDCDAWFCTQYLDVSGMKGPADILTGVLNHVWGGGFNQSSEHHEGTSGFSLAQKQKIDARVTDVNKWEKESDKDPRFVLDVDWHPANTTPRKLIEGTLSMFGATTAPATSKALGNILLASRLLG